MNPTLSESKSRFSATLITNNTQVSILALALGVTWGIGTLILLFTTESFWEQSFSTMFTPVNRSF